MSKSTNNQKFECLFQFLVSKGKMKHTSDGYQNVRTKKDKVLDEIKLEI